MLSIKVIINESLRLKIITSCKSSHFIVKFKKYRINLVRNPYYIIFYQMSFASKKNAYFQSSSFTAVVYYIITYIYLNSYVVHSARTNTVGATRFNCRHKTILSRGRRAHDCLHKFEYIWACAYSRRWTHI
jgi:hypothetical protein